MAQVNCVAPANAALCVGLGITHYPTLTLFVHGARVTYRGLDARTSVAELQRFIADVAGRPIDVQSLP